MALPRKAVGTFTTGRIPTTAMALRREAAETFMADTILATATVAPREAEPISMAGKILMIRIDHYCTSLDIHLEINRTLPEGRFVAL
jgi:hypothetical protein